jgi:DNA replication terminus site-binding protein
MNTDFAHYNEEQLRKLGELHSLLRHSDIGSSYLASLPEPRSVEELNPPQEINVTHSVPDVDTLVDIYRQQRVDKVHVRMSIIQPKSPENIPGSLWSKQS